MYMYVHHYNLQDIGIMLQLGLQVASYMYLMYHSVL